jgi:hypothetical protein
VKQIHVWPNHIRVTSPDLVLVRSPDEPLGRTLKGLARLGFDVDPTNIEVHDGVLTN